MLRTEYEGWLGVCDAKDPWESVRLGVREGLEEKSETGGADSTASVCPKAFIPEPCLGDGEQSC